jgi:hypothetical protein
MRWYVTNGQEGREPAEVSHAFSYAGYYIMRSGWDPQARWLLFDGGPFGYGHQHEDKLQIIVEAYGKLLLLDPGSYTYERSKWREYFIDSFAHNVILVDGQPQRRRSEPRASWVVKEPLPHVWTSTPAQDYAEATFDENFGGAVKRNVTHTRAVLFVKPDYWVVLDTLTAKDGKAHRYEALWHYDSPVATDGLRVLTLNPKEANLTLAVRPDPGLALKIVEGQENPVQGWLPRGNAHVRPAPVAIVSTQGAGVTRILTVLVPAPPGAPDPLASVEGDGTEAVIRFRDGRVQRVRFGDGAATVSKQP